MNLPLNFALPPCPDCSSRECGDVCRFTSRSRRERERHVREECAALHRIGNARAPSQATAAARIAVRRKLRLAGITCPPHATTRELAELLTVHRRHMRARELDQENRYAEAGMRREIAARYTGRPDHDTGPAGEKMKG